MSRKESGFLQQPKKSFFRLHREVWGRRGIIQALVELTVIYRGFDILMEFFRKFD